MPSNNQRVQIDHHGRVPVTQQIAGIIRGRIERGRATGVWSDEPGEQSYPPGRAIPSLERIRQETGCAVKTIQKAVRILVAEGQVEVVDGKGTFVTEGTP